MVFKNYNNGQHAEMRLHTSKKLGLWITEGLSGLHRMVPCELFVFFSCLAQQLIDSKNS